MCVKFTRIFAIPRSPEGLNQQKTSLFSQIPSKPIWNMKISPLNILPAFKFQAQAVQKFPFLFTHNSLLGIPPNKNSHVDDHKLLHVRVVAATVNRKVKPREWKWMFWFPYIVKSVLCIELFSILIINNMFHYLTCAQSKDNVNEFIC